MESTMSSLFLPLILSSLCHVGRMSIETRYDEGSIMNTPTQTGGDCDITPVEVPRGGGTRFKFIGSERTRNSALSMQRKASK